MPLSFPDTVLDEHDHLSSVPELFERTRDPHHDQRHLNNDNNGDGSTSAYYIDRDGNEYEPYSMAWRYLGMYMDCDVDAHEETNVYVTDDGIERRRHLNSGSGDGDDACARKLLWAAYVDPRYQGGSIGEYQYMDPYTKEWDDSSCETTRCAKMDCHDPHTHFRLVGVFKETDGLYDWGEQLFKHHGYCQWDEDTYETMQDLIEAWPQDGCKKLEYSDSNGNTLYSATKPLPEGNLTVALYYNEACTQDSGMLWSDYIEIYYENYYRNYYYYYNYADVGPNKAKKWLAKIQTWNEAMAVYKMCQPCRAYSLNQDDGSGSGSGSGDRVRERARRHLGDNNDGGGDAEQWGYDCEDDAGYTNCNQCYKFETKTDMAPAIRDDLRLASNQGTILGIYVNRTHFGKGGMRSSALYPIEYVEIFLGAIALIGLAVVAGLQCSQWMRKRQQSRSLQEKLNETLDYTTNCAVAGFECNVSLREQRPTVSDPNATDLVRFPRFRTAKVTYERKKAANNNNSRSRKNETNDDDNNNDDDTDTITITEDEAGLEQQYVSMDDGSLNDASSLDDDDSDDDDDDDESITNPKRRGFCH